MEWTKIAPWNWFKDEQGEARVRHPVAERRAPRSDLLGEWQDDFERIFEDVFGPSGFGLPAWADKPRNPNLPLRPRVDIAEGKKAYTVRVELPGVERDDVSLTVEGETLVIRAEKRREQEEEEEGYHWVETAYGAVQRVISLPEDADSESIDARFKNGVLKLRLPKHAAPVHGRRQVEIQKG